jgi:ribosome-binding protein aMBF1 (putative translation factor)
MPFAPKWTTLLTVSNAISRFKQCKGKSSVSKAHNLKKTAVRIEFGKRLKRKRQEQDLTQEMLAEKAGLAPNYVGSVERGERNIGLENIVILAKALGIAPKNLMPG